MGNMLQRVSQRSSFGSISMDDWASWFSFGGMNYPFSFQQTMQGHVEEPDYSFEGMVHSAFKSNGIVFGCMLARQMLFSEARFQYRSLTNGRPGKLFGTAGLSILERPWPGGTTGDLLSRAIQDVDLAGNFFAVRRKGRIKRLRPDWITIILGSYDDPTVEAGDIDAEVVGYLYHPGGRGSGRNAVPLLQEEVAHFAPIPDPAATYRGMSWLIPIIREFLSDSAMIQHKTKFFENGATPNMVVTLDPSIKKEAFKEWVQMFKEKHEGVVNAYKTLYLGAGSTVMPVGKDFKQMEFSITQAAGETRIAVAAGVPPVIVGASEGIKSSTYSNYSQARRRFADLTIRPLWRNMANSMSILVPVPPASELWYDDRDIPFLVEEFKDRAEVQQMQSASVASLINSGYTPKSVVEAVVAQDFALLKHTGLFSVQLQPAGTKLVPPGSAAPTTTAPVKKPKDPAVKKKARAMTREDAADMLLAAANERRDQTPTPPHIEVHTHLDRGAVEVHSPVTVDANTTIADGAIRMEPHTQIDSPVTIERGAVQVDAPVTVQPAEVTFEEGAIRGGDTHVAPPELIMQDGFIRVAAPAITFEEGAIRGGDTKIDVAPPELRLEAGAIVVDAPTTIERGAVQVDAPVTIERTEVHVDEGAVQVSNPITVERTEVHIDEGAVRVEAPVTVAPAEVRFEKGAVQVDAPTVIERGAVQVDAPVTVEAPPPAHVTIEDGAIRADITVQGAGKKVTTRHIDRDPETHEVRQIRDVEEDAPDEEA